MRYQATGYCSTDNGKPIVVSGNIEPQLFEDVERSKNVCLLALGLEEKFQLVVDNYAEWEIELLTAAQKEIIGSSNIHDSTLLRILLTRRLTNVLTAFRLYVDQTDYALSKLFGNPSKELEAVKNYKALQYDSCFGYRFLEALRNHVQHCDLPIDAICFDQKPVSEKNIFPFHCSIIPQTSLETISENVDFKKSVIKELQTGPNSIDLRPHIREYISCIANLHKKIHEICSPTFDKDRSYYEGVIKTFSNFEGKTVKFPKLILTDEKGVKVKTIELYQGLLEVYDALKKKHNNLGNITNSFVSNFIADK